MTFQIANYVNMLMLRMESQKCNSCNNEVEKKVKNSRFFNFIYCDGTMVHAV